MSARRRVVGRHVVTRAGKNLGMVDDVVIDERDGRIVGYSLEARMCRSASSSGSRRGAYPTTQLVRTDLVVMRMLEDALVG